jgi:tetratricopeptide (TPR) repeat protein
MPFETDCKSEARMIITCPHCGKRHKLPEDWSANKVKCSRCGEKFFLDELASEFIAPDEPQKDAAPPPVNSQARKPTLPIRLAVGISSVLVIAGATTFYFFHVVPENKFRQAMREAEEAENAQRWDDALNAYYRAERIKPHDANATNAWWRVEEKRRLWEYAQAMMRGKAAEQSNDWETALREYQTALMRKSNDAEAKASVTRAQYQFHMQQGREAEQQKRWDMALIAYSNALVVKLNDAEATEALQRIRKFMTDAGKSAVVSETSIQNSKAEPPQTNSGQKGEKKTGPLQQKSGPSKQVETNVNLQWATSELSRVPTISLKDNSASPEQLKTSIARTILEKSAKEKISVASIPYKEKNGWWCTKYYNGATENPKQFYQYVGEHLLIANHYLLEGKDALQKREGLAVALHAAAALNDESNDHDLAAAICDAYVLPNLDAAEPGQCEWASKRNVIEQVAIIYEDAKQTSKMEKAFKLLLETAPNRNTADYARYKLAQLCYQKGRYDEALQHLKDIDSKEGMGGAKELISVVEKKIAGKGPHKRGDQP